MQGHSVAVIAAPSPTVGSVEIDAASFADTHRLLGGSGEPIPFGIS